MNNLPVSLREVDRVEILTLMDNYADVLLQNSDIVTRPPREEQGEIPSDTLVAEHGLSLLVTVHCEGKKHTVLFDTGYSQIGVPHNLKRLGVDLNEIEAIVLSHGHMDHTGSLYALLDTMTNRVPLVAHPEAFLFPRYFVLDDGRRLEFPKTLTREELIDRKIEVLESKTRSLLADNTVMITGEVERTTKFEKGLPNALMEKDGKIVEDPISDDQSIIVNLGGKGLVVISGCSHAGIINTVLFAKKIAGVQEVHAILGGFHLSGPVFEPIVEKTIVELKKIDPQIIVPMHCTGWKAIKRFSEEFHSAFILNGVGSRFTLT